MVRRDSFAIAWIVVKWSAPTNSIDRGALTGGMRRREEALGQGVAAEEKSGVGGVAPEGVPEEWDGGDIAGEEAGSVMRITAQELPGGKIGDKEKLDGAEERGETDTGDSAAIAEPKADGYVDEETGVNDEYHAELVETDKQVARKKRKQRKCEGEAAVLEDRAGEERHGADGREIPGMRGDAHGGGHYN